MSESNSSRRQESKDQYRRRMILSAWRGCEQPADLRRNEKMAGQVVGRILKKAGLGDRLVEEEMVREWAGIVGEFLARHSRPVSLKSGVLQVAVLQASVRYDLERNCKKDIAQKLAARFGRGVVRDVRFVNG